MILKPLGIVESDPLSIHLNGDNDSSISANILFPQGITVDTPIYPSQAIKITVPTPGSFETYMGTMEIFKDGDASPYASIGLTRSDIGFLYEELRLYAYNKASQDGLSVLVAAADALTSNFSGGGVGVQAGQGLGTGNGGHVTITAGPHFSAGGGLGGDIILTPGYDYSGSGNHGTVRVHNPNLGTYWTLVDNGGNVTTQALATSGTTTIQSLTGVLKGTSGVVSTASSSDLLTAIGTIDISSNTNLAVTSPITLTGDTVGFDFSTNNTWGGTQLWGNETWIKEDIKFYIGDNGAAAGNVSFLMDISNSGNLLVSAENGFSKGWVFTDLDVILDVNSNLQLADSPSGSGPYFYIGDSSQGAGYVSIQHDPNSTGNILIEGQSGFTGGWEFSGIDLYASNSANFGYASHTTLMSVGASLASAIVSPSTTSDAFSSRKQSTSSAIRAGLFQSEWNGSSTSSNAIQGLNIFVSTSTSATGSLTGTAALRGNRVTARHRATNAAATVANAIAVSAAYIADTSAAAVTNAYGYVAEPPTIGLGHTTTNYYGAFFDAGTVTGTLTNNHHIYLEELTGGTNRFEMLFQTAGRAYFRDASQYMYSSAASTLDDSAATTRNFRINGTTEMSISSTLVDIPTNDIAIASGAKFYFEGSGGDTYAYYDSGSSSLKFYVNGALAMELK